MTWTLFLDDEREPTWDLIPCTPAIDCDVAIKLVEDFGIPNIISFDHDLGKYESGEIKPTGMFFLKWLINKHFDNVLNLSDIDRIIVHSANPAGAKNIAGLWDGFAKHVLNKNVLAEIRPRKSLKD